MVGPEALKLGFKKTLVMTSGLRGSDIVHNIVESLKYHGLEVVVYDQVESNPKDYNVMDSVTLYQEQECDSFISIGGGSTHDACKGARISVAHDGRNVNDFEGFNMSENPKNPPHIADLDHGGHRIGDLVGVRHHRHDDRPRQPAQVRCLRRRVVATLAVDDPVLYYSAPSTTPRSAASTCSRTPRSPMSPGSNFEPSLGNAICAIKLTAGEPA